MKYNSVIKGRFISRPNRFIAKVEIGGRETVVHVKNTGRCRELLVPGAVAYLEAADNPERRTAWDLIAVEKNGILINMDSQAPNRAAEEWMKSGGLIPGAEVRREVRYGDSRLDFLLSYGGRLCYTEVKGVTLENDGIAMFPDAPTERGVKHLRELIRAVEEGYDACALFIVQMKGVREFRPNDTTHPEFGKVLRAASESGVRIAAMDCIVTPDSLNLDSPVPVKL